MSVAPQPGGRESAPRPLDLVQDFANTVIPEWDRDDLATPEELVAWLHARGLVEAGTAADASALLRAHELRSALRALARANTSGAPPAAAERRRVDEALRALPVALASGRAGIRVVPDGQGVAAGLAAIAVVAAAATADGTWQRLKACRQVTCGWVFYDGSRNRSSSWCSMRVCGGRVKARAARRRRSARPS